MQICYNVAVKDTSSIQAHFRHNQKNRPSLQYVRVITKKRGASGGVHLRGLASGQHTSEKRRSGGEPLETLCPT